MPSRPPRQCSSPMCSGYASVGSYCDVHKGDANMRHGGWGKRESSTARGYGRAWQKLRIVVLRRDNYLCQLCLVRDRLEVAREVDHIKPKAQGGTDELSNLQSLCHKCHKEKTINERIRND